MGKIIFDSVKIIWKMFISFKNIYIYIYILILTTYTIILFFKKKYHIKYAVNLPVFYFNVTKKKSR